MSYHEIISQAIRETLDAEGFEIPWHEIRLAATAVEKALADVFEAAWYYNDLSDS